MSGGWEVRVGVGEWRSGEGRGFVCGCIGAVSFSIDVVNRRSSAEMTRGKNKKSGKEARYVLWRK